MRTWMWSDYGWAHKDEFFARMPRDILQSNWYYSRVEGEKDLERLARIRFFDDLDKFGFDQIPCGSAYKLMNNLRDIVRHCRNGFGNSPHLKGYLLAPWTRTWERFHERNAKALDSLEMARNA